MEEFAAAVEASGIATHLRQSRWTYSSSSMMEHSASQLRWVSTQPLAGPVVPEV